MQPKSNESAHFPDALLPPEMAKLAEKIGQKKIELDFLSTFTLAVLAGSFIAWGAIFFTAVVTNGETSMPYGVGRLMGGIAFSLGLILVIVGGAELFTGNNLIVMAWASRRATTKQVLRNWLIVYAGNFVGAVGTALIVYLAGFADGNSGAVGDTMLRIAASKCSLGWWPAVASGIGCNILVCLAVWLCMSARTVTDKVLVIVFPITAFVTTGMEHCVANMYFVPAAMLVKTSRSSDSTYEMITLSQFLVANLVPVTLGNMIGGVVFVGLVYWFVYLRNVADA